MESSDEAPLVDFHLHTTCSDGSWPREAIFDFVRSRDVRYFSISDHDNMDAYPVPDDLLARCVPGIEIDTEHEGGTVHLLAYGLEPGDQALERLKVQQIHRERRANLIVERLNQLGVPLTFQQVSQASALPKSIGRPHIARALVLHNYCSGLQDAFDTFLAEGRPAYVPLQRLTTTQAISLVHGCDGLAVLAHPKRLLNQALIRVLCDCGLDGIEVGHPSADRAYEESLLKVVAMYGLVATAGSDFHGRPEDRPIGVSWPVSRLRKLLLKVKSLSP